MQLFYENVRVSDGITHLLLLLFLFQRIYWLTLGTMCGWATCEGTPILGIMFLFHPARRSFGSSGICSEDFHLNHAVMDIYN